MNKRNDACPSMHGTMLGYQIEYLNPDNIWKPLELKEGPEGVRYPCFGENVLRELGLLGYEQACALAWAAKANSWLRTLRVRLVPYRIKYSMEATRNEEKAETLDLFVGNIDNIPDVSSVKP